jgi:hypothetical protein
MDSREDRTHLTFLALLFLLPFVGRPFFAGESAHFADLLRPGGDSALLSAHPVYPWIAAAFTRMFGADLWRYHLASMPFHLASLLSFYALARRFVRQPFWAAVLWLASPHFWLTANTLSPDAPAAAFLLGGLAVWMAGWDRKDPARLAAGGALLGLSALTGGAGWLGFSVAGAWSALDGRGRRTWRWAALAVPVAAVCAWRLWAGAGPAATWPDAARFRSLAVFAAGTTPVLVLPALFAATGRLRLPAWPAVLAAGAGLALGFFSGGSSLVALQLAFWLAAFLVWSVAAASRPWNGVSEGPFLSVWAALGLLAVLLAPGPVSGRLFPAAGPALVLLTVRALESRAGVWAADPWRRGVTAGALCVLAALIAVADHSLARADASAARDAIRFLEENTSRAPAYYPDALEPRFGHRFDGSRWLPAEAGFVPPRGALVLTAWRTLRPGRALAPARAETVARFGYETLLPFRTWDVVSGAGYYGADEAPLPFSLSRAPLELYTVAVAY